MIFGWDAWNRRHIARHGVTEAEAQHVVRRAADPFPRKTSDDKWLVWGRTAKGRYLQVIFIYRELEEVDFESLPLEDLIALSDGYEDDVIYVVHAMPLPARLLKQYRRMRR